ncbi:MBL fold metallo-hydrolase [Rhizobium daejeonense]
MARKPANPYYSGPVTDHFDGIRFFNPEGVEPGNLRDLWKWRTNGERARWPKRVERPSQPAAPAERIGGDGLRVTMIGHASLLIQVAGLNILTDPVWSERASPFSFAGPKRVIEPGIPFEALPPIDLVIVTHNHYDHLDLQTLSRLGKRHAPQVVTPLGNDPLIRKAMPEAVISVMDWGDRIALSDGVSIDAEPCHHWSARGMNDRRMALWAAFVISTPAGKVYHIGDTGFHDGINYKAAAAKHGAFRLAVLPIGAYEPRWFMKGQHQNPEEAVAGMRLCNAAYAVGHHFGTFQLTDEAIEAPVEHLSQALAAEGMEPERFRPLRAGEAFDVPPVA